MQSWRRRLHDIRTVIGKTKERFRAVHHHLHVKVTHEVTVQLPPDWKPRRERMKPAEATAP